PSSPWASPAVLPRGGATMWARSARVGSRAIDSTRTEKLVDLSHAIVDHGTVDIGAGEATPVLGMRPHGALDPQNRVTPFVGQRVADSLLEIMRRRKSRLVGHPH